MEQRSCPQCGYELKYKEGFKNSKKWQGWFCQNRQCAFVEWIRSNPDPAPKPTNQGTGLGDAIMRELAQIKLQLAAIQRILITKKTSFYDTETPITPNQQPASTIKQAFGTGKGENAPDGGQGDMPDGYQSQ